MYETIKYNDDSATRDTAPKEVGDTVLVIGCSVKQPGSESVVSGTIDAVNSLFGGYPINPNIIASSSISTEQRHKYIDALHRNIPFSLNTLKMMCKGRDYEPNVVAVRIGKYDYSKLEFKENKLSSNPYFKPTITGMITDSLKFKAFEGGDEFNCFWIKIEPNIADGLAAKLSIQYRPPLSSSFGSLTTINDNKIAETYVMNIEGFNIDQIVSKFNNPHNPFSRYIYAEYTPISIQKSIAYVGGSTIQILQGDEGAYRLESVKSLVLTSAPSEQKFTNTKTQTYPMIFSSDIDKKYITKPILDIANSWNIDPNVNPIWSQSLVLDATDGSILQNVARMRKIPINPTFLAYWDKNSDTHTGGTLHVDKNIDKKPSDTQWRIQNESGQLYLYLSTAVNDGIPKPIITIGAQSPIVNTINMTYSTSVDDGISKDKGIVNRFNIVYSNSAQKQGYIMSDDIVIPGGSDAHIEKIIVFSSITPPGDTEFIISEELETVYLVGYADYGQGEKPIILDKYTLDQWIGSRAMTVNDQTPISPGGFGLYNYTALAKESVDFIETLVPVIVSVDSAEKLGSDWNTHYVNGNTFYFGGVLPSEYSLYGTVQYKHTLKEGTDYRVVSQGNNPASTNSTIMLNIITNGSPQMTAIEQGMFKFSYTVVPTLMSHTSDIWEQLKGGVEENFMTDLEYWQEAKNAIIENIYKWKPRHLYVCGLSLDFSREQYDDVNNVNIKIPLAIKRELSELVLRINKRIPLTMSIDAIRHYIWRTNDPNLKTFKDNYYNSFINADTEDIFSPIILTAAAASYDLRVVGGLFALDKSTTDNGRRVKYLIPIPTSLISLRNSLVQNFIKEKTHITSNMDLPSEVKSLLLCGGEHENIFKLLGFEFYSSVIVSGNQRIIKCLSDVTGAISSNGKVVGRKYQMIDDIVKTGLVVASHYADLNVKNIMGMEDQVLKNHEDQIGLKVMNHFKNMGSSALNSCTCDIGFLSTADKIDGKSDMQLDFNINQTIRSINVTANISIG